MVGSVKSERETTLIGCEVQRSEIGPKILLAAVVVVAGVIGISGIYPQAIDAEWTQDSATHLPKIRYSPPARRLIKASATATALSSPHPPAEPGAFGLAVGATTQGGGATGCENGCGTVFKVTPLGVESVLHSFAGGSDGNSPRH